MKLFTAYLLQKRRALLFFAGCGFVLLLSFLLYGLPLEAVLYPLAAAYTLAVRITGNAYYRIVSVSED